MDNKQSQNLHQKCGNKRKRPAESSDEDEYGDSMDDFIVEDDSEGKEVLAGIQK